MAGTHNIDPQELMAYLDREVGVERAKEIAAHMEQCAECRRLSEDLGGVSRRLAAWQPEPSSRALTEAVMAALHREHGAGEKTGAAPEGRRYRWLQWRPRTFVAGFGLAGLSVLVLVVATTMPRMAHHDRLAPAAPAPRAEVAAQHEAVTSDSAAKGPMVVRTAALSLVATDFERARAALEGIVRRRGGYLGNLTVNAPAGFGRSLEAVVRAPASQLDGILGELKALGRVESETQSGVDVTTPYVDLEARLVNARNTERRLTDLLRDRTGRLTDVLAVENELSRVRGEVERMEAERKSLANQVDYATVNVTLKEEYHAQLPGNSAPALVRFRNAAVEGYRSVADAATGIVVFVLSDGPAIVLWGGLLYLAVRLVYKIARAGQWIRCT